MIYLDLKKACLWLAQIPPSTLLSVSNPHFSSAFFWLHSTYFTNYNL